MNEHSEPAFMLLIPRFPKCFRKKKIPHPYHAVSLPAFEFRNFYVCLNSGIFYVSMSDAVSGDIRATPYPHTSPIPQMQPCAVLPPPALLMNAIHHDGNLLVPAKRGFNFVTHGFSSPSFHQNPAQRLPSHQAEL